MGAPPGATGRSIGIVIPIAYQTNNAVKGMHFAAYRRYRRSLAALIAESGTAPPDEPFDLALVRVLRTGTSLLDYDNLVGGLKPLIDCLVAPQGKRHPEGMSYIRDDSPACMRLEAQQRLCPVRAACQTEVTIFELDAAHRSNVARLRAMGVTVNGTPKAAAAIPVAQTTKKPAGGSPPAKPQLLAERPARMTAKEYLALGHQGRASKGGRR